MYESIVLILQDSTFGLMIDVFGRKKFIIAGQIMITISLAATPHFHEEFISFLSLRILGVIGANMSLNMPLIPDYVSIPYIGRASALFMPCMLLPKVMIICLLNSKS